MKKWILRFVLMLTLVALIWALLWMGIYYRCLTHAANHRGQGPVWISHNINPSLQCQRLDQCHQPKIVILGGSNAAFGICSELLQRHYGRPVFNTGTNGDIGLRMQLALFEDYLTPDDIVIITPEYHQFGKDFWGGLILCHVLITDPRFISHLSPYQALRLSPCWEEWQRLADDTQDPDFGSSLCYSSVALNSYGDIAQPRQHKTFDPYGIEGFGRYNRYAFRYLAAFLRRCPATTVLMPPAFSQNSYHSIESIVDRIHQQLRRQGTPFAVEGSRYCFADSLFYDTGYHLTSDAAELRTLMMIHDIDSILAASNR